tara:strand:- start:2900 stop:3094 length:195 start_codon:yes stop_codon:yes gene_type:complete
MPLDYFAKLFSQNVFTPLFTLLFIPLFTGGQEDKRRERTERSKRKQNRGNKGKEEETKQREEKK